MNGELLYVIPVAEDVEYSFYQTCSACPEQYEVIINGTDKQVGYIRLRHGYLRCDTPDCGDKTIYEKEFEDINQGCFENDKQRFYYLSKIAQIIYKESCKNDA